MDHFHSGQWFQDEIAGSEKPVDIGATNHEDAKKECQALCQLDPKCTGVDIGVLRNRLNECFLNYGNPNLTVSNKEFKHSKKDNKEGCNYHG